MTTSSLAIRAAKSAQAYTQRLQAIEAEYDAGRIETIEDKLKGTLSLFRDKRRFENELRFKTPTDNNSYVFSVELGNDFSFNSDCGFVEGVLGESPTYKAIKDTAKSHGFTKTSYKLERGNHFPTITILIDLRLPEED